MGVFLGFPLNASSANSRKVVKSSKRAACRGEQHQVNATAVARKARRTRRSNKTLLQRAQELQAKVGLPAKIEYLRPLEPHDGPLAMDILNRVMQYAARWAAVYRPALPGEPENEHEDEAAYLKWTNVVIEAARLLMPYQSPKLRPIAVTDVEQRAGRAASNAADMLAMSSGPNE
jgi:hypothetical protein